MWSQNCSNLIPCSCNNSACRRKKDVFLTKMTCDFDPIAVTKFSFLYINRFSYYTNSNFNQKNPVLKANKKASLSTTIRSNFGRNRQRKAHQPTKHPRKKKVTLSKLLEVTSSRRWNADIIRTFPGRLRLFLHPVQGERRPYRDQHMSLPLLPTRNRRPLCNKLLDRDGLHRDPGIKATAAGRFAIRERARLHCSPLPKVFHSSVCALFQPLAGFVPCCDVG
jgi:hypothetical protein